MRGHERSRLELFTTRKQFNDIITRRSSQNKNLVLDWLAVSAHAVSFTRNSGTLFRRRLGLAPFRRFLERSELPRCDADEPLEVAGELALVGEGGVQDDLRQGQARSCLHEVLAPFDAARDDVPR
jgi:hypothetical protein